MSDQVDSSQLPNQNEPRSNDRDDSSLPPSSKASTDCNATQRQPKKRKQMAPGSPVWSHFTKYTTEKGEKRARCNYCGASYAADSSTNGTTTLKNHMNSCMKNPCNNETYQMQKVKEGIYALFDEYKMLSAGPVSTTQPLQSSLIASSSSVSSLHSMWATIEEEKFRWDLRREYDFFVNEVGDADNKNELDKYLGEEKEMDDEGFDILHWWKLNAPRFPIIAQMACDILVVPVSTVASESAFSMGGRVLDTFRSSLTPKMVQCLMCAKDWLRNEVYPISIEEDLEKLEKMDCELFKGWTWTNRRITHADIKVALRNGEYKALGSSIIFIIMNHVSAQQPIPLYCF